MANGMEKNQFAIWLMVCIHHPFFDETFRVAKNDIWHGQYFLGAIHNCWVYGSWYDLIMHTSTYYSVSIVYCENYSFIKKYWRTYFIYSFEINNMNTNLYKHLYLKKIYKKKKREQEENLKIYNGINLQFVFKKINIALLFK